MQRRMPRFVGRGLPTVWETVCAVGPPKSQEVSAEPEDMAAIQAWAAEIDTWYRHVATESGSCISAKLTVAIDASLYVRSITLLNYHLHKLFVSLRSNNTLTAGPVHLLPTPRYIIHVGLGARRAAPKLARCAQDRELGL